MPLTPEELKAGVEQGLTAIDAQLGYGDPATQPPNGDVSVSLAPRDSILNNVAYHDYNRIELGTPVISQKIPDKKLSPKLTQLLDFTVDMPWMFSPPVLTAAPTDASQVEELIADMKEDLANMAAGPVPEAVQVFAVKALHDYIDQRLWTALSPGERDRLGQLASLWAAYTGVSLTASSGGNSGSTTTTTTASAGGGNPVLELLGKAGGAVLDVLTPW